MAYIGKKPAPAALTSSDISDGIITNAKLAQDIISADTALGAEPADTDEFLVSDAGVLKRMDYSHIKSSSDFVLLDTETGTGTVSVDGHFSSTYQNYLLIGSHLSNDGTDEELRMRFRQGDADVTASSYYRVWNGNYGTNADGQSRYDGADYGADHIVITNNWDPGIAKTTQFTMWFFNPSNSDTHKYIQWQSSNVSPNSSLSYMNFNGAANYYGNTTALTGYTFYGNDDDIDSLNLKLYGLK